MAAQLPSAEKKARADYVIDTSGSKEDTNRQIDAIFDQLVEIVQPSAIAAVRARLRATEPAGTDAAERTEEPDAGKNLTSSFARFGRDDHVVQQHRDRERADAAGHRRDRAGDLRHRGVDVADDERAVLLEDGAPRGTFRIERFDQRRVGDAIDADVDHRRAGLDEIRA